MKSELKKLEKILGINFKNLDLLHKSLIHKSYDKKNNNENEENIKYQASVQESMAEFQSQNQINLQNAANSNNRLLQKAIQDAKVKLDNNTQAIQKYQAEISEYQAEVTLAVQEQTTKMQHYQLLYSQLKTEYDQVFVMAAPQAQA